MAERGVGRHGAARLHAVRRSARLSGIPAAALTVLWLATLPLQAQQAERSASPAAAAPGPPSGPQSAAHRAVPRDSSRHAVAASVGLPPQVRAFFGPYLGLGGPSHGNALVGAGFYRDLFSPALGALGVQAEGYLGTSRSGGRPDGRVLLGVRSPVLRLGAGLELGLPHGEASPFVSVMHPLRRGGVFVPGTVFHATWSFGGADRFRLGFAIPIGQPLLGEDRPRRDHVDLAETGDEARALPSAVAPMAPPAADPLAHAVTELAERVRRVNAVVVPYAGRSGSREAGDRDVADSLRVLAGLLAPAGPQPVPAVIADYHSALDRAFSLALDPAAAGATPQGRAVAEAARSVLLGSVILPYDRLLGQKREPGTLAPLALAAQEAFASRSGGVAAAGARGRASARAAWVLQQVLAAMDAGVAAQTRRWGDDRLVWLPLQLALRDEQHETQAQIDSLIARATGGEFSDSNQVAYAHNEQFQWELYRSIHDARNYHVLWVHDFRGLNESGLPDGVAFRQAAYGYLDALVQRVKAYDATGVLPEFHIINDQYYFESDRSRLWMAMLRDPLDHGVRLRGAPPAWQRTIDSLRAELRSAVAGSKRLQAEARANGGDRWLKDKVSVHVHITQQADPTFWSRDILPLVGLSDNALRDHRKLVFYDLTEGDPYRGLLIVTGMGVGENFAGAEWEDRAVLLRGSAALVAKREAAALLAGNGVTPAELPLALRPSTVRIAAAARAPIPSFDMVPARVMQIHNEVGYGTKRVTVAKAMLYSLLPPGSVAKIPDSLWNNPLWASLLLGQALRGGKVVIMAPAVANAPAPGRPEMSLAETVLSRLLVAGQVLGPGIARAGGMLHVGIYANSIPVDDLPARIDTALATRGRTPWLRDLDPFSPEVIDSLRAVAVELRASGFRSAIATGAPRAPGGSGGYVGSNASDPGGHPKLHIKAQFFASGEGWENLFRQPGWGPILATYFRDRARLIRSRANYAEFYRLTPESVRGNVAPGTPGGTGHPSAATSGLLFRDQVRADKPDGVIYYLLLGSHNEDRRSALLDGESMLLLSHFGAAVGIDDFVLLPGLCTWVDTPAQLHRYLPLQSPRIQRFARWTRILY